MRDQYVDSLGELVHCDRIEAVPGKVPHGAVCLGHDQRMVPVVSGRTDDLVKTFGGTFGPRADFVDAGNVQVAETLHQVSRRTYRVLDLFVVLMAGRQCAVCGAPPADGQRVRFGIQVAAQRKQCIACRLGFGADVVPQRRVVKCGRGTVPGTVFIVERGGPDPSFGPVKGRFVEKRFGDGRTEILGETLVILFVRHRDVSPGRVFA